MALFHFSTGTYWPQRPLVQRDACAEMWARLRRRFSKVLACVLMPDHLHLLIDFVSAQALSKAMASELSAFTRSVWKKEGALWRSGPAPASIPNLKHLRRQIRYVHLNPCRDRLVADPLEWEWSTHREFVGAASGSWIDRAVVEQAFGYPERVFAERFHQYVSGDPDVKVEGTRLPARLPEREILASLSSVEWAVLQATRSATDAKLKATHARRLMLLAAERLGLKARDRMSDWVGIKPRAIQYVLSEPTSAQEEAELKAVFLLLSDAKRFGK